MAPCRCGKLLRRHSNSIDVDKRVCGSCRSRLQFLGRFKQDGTPAAKRGPSQFSLFVKSQFNTIKQQFPQGKCHCLAPHFVSPLQTSSRCHSAQLKSHCYFPKGFLAASSLIKILSRIPCSKLSGSFLWEVVFLSRGSRGCWQRCILFLMNTRSLQAHQMRKSWKHWRNSGMKGKGSVQNHVFQRREMLWEFLISANDQSRKSSLRAIQKQNLPLW